MRGYGGRRARVAFGRPLVPPTPPAPAWTPADEPLIKGYWRQGAYTNTGTGLWTKVTGSNLVGQAGASPTATNSEPVFPGAASQYLLGGLATQYLANGAWTCIVGFKATVAVARAGAIYEQPGIVTQGGQNWGQHFTSAGYTAYQFDNTCSPSIREIALPLAINTWAIGTSRHLGSGVASGFQARLNKTAFTSLAPAGTFGNSINGGQLVVGTDGVGTTRLTGTIRFIIIADSALSDIVCDKAVDWARAEWPTDFV